MKRLLLFSSLMAICTIWGCQKNFNLSQVQWAPTMEDVVNMGMGDIKMIVFFYDNPILAGGRTEPFRLEEIGRITEPGRIEVAMDTIENDGKSCRCDEECAYGTVWPTWMGVVDGKNRGLRINIGLNHEKERVEWWTRYSERLYALLIEYGTIKAPKKSIFINDPNIIRFEAPPQFDSRKKVKTITTYMERDLNQVYAKVDPNMEPVYIKVDPNSPKVYIAVDSNLAHIYIRKLLPAVNIMKYNSEELMAQNRWLKDALNNCLTKLETEKGFQTIPNEPNDNFGRLKQTGTEFVPYAKLPEKPLPEAADINRLSSAIYLHCSATNMFINSTLEAIKVFEQRMKHIGADFEEIDEPAIK